MLGVYQYNHIIPNVVIDHLKTLGLSHAIRFAKTLQEKVLGPLRLRGYTRRFCASDIQPPELLYDILEERSL